MSDLRFDPVSGQWTLIAPNRVHRPVELQAVEKVSKGSVCPFCAGNESETPAALALYDSSGTALSTSGATANDWLLRVVPNKYASFGSVDVEANGHTPDPCHHHGPFIASSLPGLQELLIPSRLHVSSLSELDDSETHVLWQASQERIAQMHSGGIARHAMLFMNYGAQAGASLEHVHVQLMGTPVARRSTRH